MVYAAFFVGVKSLLLSGVASIGMTSLWEVFLYSYQARNVQVQVQVQVQGQVQGQEEGFHGMEAAAVSIGGDCSNTGTACLPNWIELD